MFTLDAWPVLPPPTAVLYQGMVRTKCFCEPSPGGIPVSWEHDRLIRGTFVSVPVQQCAYVSYNYIIIVVLVCMNVRLLMYA